MPHQTPSRIPDALNPITVRAALEGTPPEERFEVGKGMLVRIAEVRAAIHKGTEDGSTAANVFIATRSDELARLIVDGCCASADEATRLLASLTEEQRVSILSPSPVGDGTFTGQWQQLIPGRSTAGRLSR